MKNAFSNEGELFPLVDMEYTTLLQIFFRNIFFTQVVNYNTDFNKAQKSHMWKTFYASF